MSGRLQLRRGVVVAEDPLTVEVDGERRAAWADTGLLGEMREGDEVVVNVAALDLDLGSGGFDVIHVNLSRGLDGAPAGDDHVIKLNYTSLQHPVEPVEVSARRFSDQYGRKSAAAGLRVVVLPLHGYLAPAAWAAGQAGSGLEVGYIQTQGGALPGSFSRDVVELRERGLLCSHITSGPAYGGELEAISTAGALDAARGLGWDAALVGPGPGIIGSDSEFGHGGMAALDSAHAGLALGLETSIAPRISSSDPRERHLSVSHHTHTVLELLLGSARVVVPDDAPREVVAELEQAARRHRLTTVAADIDGYAASGLPTTTMGRSLEDDPLFFAAPLAAGAALRGKG